jgi:carbon monoxide dehydrogenase subunit G
MGETMSTVQQAIEVSAPLHEVYAQLADLENYPQFMTGVQEVTQVSDDRTHWVMNLDGELREFNAQLVECTMDQRVRWRSMDGPMLAETITLRPMGETRTQVVAQLEADVAALMPSDRHAQDSLNMRLKADLASFKRLIEHDPGFAQMSGTAMTSPSGIGGTATIGPMTGTMTRGGMTRGGMTDGGMTGPYNSPSNMAIRIGKGRHRIDAADLMDDDMDDMDDDL